jgi:dTDP-4-amino-4,6-dideoxygalactose transaminase
MGLGIGPGDLVATPTYSFFATAGVVARLGAVPLLVDIDPAIYAMDPADLAARLEKLSAADRGRLKAIIAVHLYGQCAEIRPILGLAASYGVPVVEDAAQAIGAEYRDGRGAGTMGRAGCLSFFPSKNLGGAGDGGMILTDDAGLAARLRTLRVHGAERRYHHTMVGGNFRLDTVQAAVLHVKLRYLDEWTRARQARADTYARLFRESGLLEAARIGLPETRYRADGVPRYHVFHQFVIRVPERERLRHALAEAGVATEVYYPVPFHLQECFAGLGHRSGDFPVAERAARETLALPMYPELTEAQQAYVVDRIRAFLRS